MMSNSKKRRAQSAVELLYVYAWTGFAIIIAIAALSYFGAFDTNNLMPQSCETGGNILCLEANIDGNTGQMNLVFRNNLPDDIVLKQVSYVVDKYTYQTYPEVTIQKGSKALVHGPILPIDSLKSSKKVTFTITYSRIGNSVGYIINGDGVIEVLSKAAT